MTSEAAKTSRSPASPELLGASDQHDCTPSSAGGPASPATISSGALSPPIASTAIGKGMTLLGGDQSLRWLATGVPAAVAAHHVGHLGSVAPGADAAAAASASRPRPDGYGSWPWRSSSWGRPSRDDPRREQNRRYQAGANVEVSGRRRRRPDTGGPDRRFGPYDAEAGAWPFASADGGQAAPKAARRCSFHVERLAAAVPAAVSAHDVGQLATRRTRYTMRRRAGEASRTLAAAAAPFVVFFFDGHRNFLDVPGGAIRSRSSRVAGRPSSPPAVLPIPERGRHRAFSERRRRTVGRLGHSPPIRALETELVEGGPARIGRSRPRLAQRGRRRRRRSTG